MKKDRKKTLCDKDSRIVERKDFYRMIQTDVQFKYIRVYLNKSVQTIIGSRPQSKQNITYVDYVKHTPYSV